MRETLRLMKTYCCHVSTFRSFWKNLNNLVFENVQIELQFNLEHVLFGILDKTEEKNKTPAGNTDTKFCSMLILFCLPFLTVLLFPGLCWSTQMQVTLKSSQSITTPL